MTKYKIKCIEKTDEGKKLHWTLDIVSEDKYLQVLEDWTSEICSNQLIFSRHESESICAKNITKVYAQKLEENE